VLSDVLWSVQDECKSSEGPFQRTVCDVQNRSRDWYWREEDDILPWIANIEKLKVTIIESLD